MTRTRAWRRHKNYTKARRKREINRSYSCYAYNDAEGMHFYPWYPNLNQYSKNKIHCSCPLCRNKTKNHGAAALYNGTYNPTLHDWRRREDMEQDLKEWKVNYEEAEN